MHWPSGSGDATDAHLNQPAGRSLPPALEPPSGSAPYINPRLPPAVQEALRAMHARVAASAPGTTPGRSPPAGPAQGGTPPAPPLELCAEGAEPGPAAKPILDDSTATTAEALGGLGQRVIVGPDGLPLTVAQASFDGTWTDPVNPANASECSTDAPELGPKFKLPPELPEMPPDYQYRAPRPPEPPQLPLFLPEPWHRTERQLDLFNTAFKYPTCTCRNGKHKKYCQAQVHTSTAKFITMLAACWSYVQTCLEVHHAAPLQIAYSARRAREVAICCTKWKAMKCKGCQHIFNYATTTPCHSRTCPVCGRKWSRKAMAAMFEYVKHHEVKRDQGMLSRDYYMHTFTEEKPATLTLKGLRASVYNVKKKMKDVWEKVVCNLPRDPGWLDQEKYAAEKQRLHAAWETTAELSCHERAAERRRLRAERRALWQSQRKRYPGKCTDAGMMGQVDLGIKGGVHVHALRYGAWHESDDVREAAGGTWTKDIAVRPENNRTGVDFRGRPLAELDQADAMKHAVCEVLKYICKTSTNPGTRGFVHPMLAVLFELATGPDSSGKCVRMREGYGTMKGIVAELDAKDEDEDEVPDHCPKCGCAEFEAVYEDYSEPTMPQGGWCLRPTMWRPPPGGS